MTPCAWEGNHRSGVTLTSVLFTYGLNGLNWEMIAPLMVHIEQGFYTVEWFICAQMLVVLFWLLAALCNLSVVYGLYGDVIGYVHLSDVVRSLYAALHRTAWALGVAWVIFACITGNAGPLRF